MAIANSSMPRTAEVGAKLPAARERSVVSPWLIVGSLVLLAIIVGVGIRAMAEPGGLWWLLEIPRLPDRVGDIALVLGPLVGVSIAIERLLETIFDSYEQSARAAAKVLRTGSQSLDWIGKEYQKAYNAVKEVSDGLPVNATPEQLGLLREAEKRLAEAEQRLQSWTSGPEYIAKKRAISVCAGLAAGLAVAILGDLGMLHIIGIPAPRLLDMVVTGLVIGAGPGPMHALIGILSEGKNALENLAQLTRDRSAKIREDVRAVRDKVENAK